jgi:hypothetical protein
VIVPNEISATSLVVPVVIQGAQAKNRLLAALSLTTALTMTSSAAFAEVGSE